MLTSSEVISLCLGIGIAWAVIITAMAPGFAKYMARKIGFILETPVWVMIALWVLLLLWLDRGHGKDR